MVINTVQDAEQVAGAVAHIMQNGTPQTVGGVRFKFKRGTFTIIEGSEPGLAKRFTVADLSKHLWRHREQWNAKQRGGAMTEQQIRDLLGEPVVEYDGSKWVDYDKAMDVISKAAKGVNWASDGK